MKSRTFFKRILVVALCMVMALGAVPLTANAISTSVPGAEGHALDSMVTGTFKGGYDSTILVYVTPNVTDSMVYTIKDNLGNFAIPSYESDKWYFDGWKTWYKGSHSGAGVINSDKANPEYDENENYYTISPNGFISDGILYPAGTMVVLKEDLWKGTYYLSAIFKPIVTVNADNGVSYVLTTNSPTIISSNQTAVKYLDDVTITYEVDEKYVLTGVNASGTNDINIDKANKIVKLNDTEKPTSVGIYARLKQQKVDFDANAGTGTMGTQVFEHSTAQALVTNEFTRDGYTFVGWNTKADGSGTSYDDGQSITFTPANDGETIKLYAQWKAKDYTVSFAANGGSAINPVTVTFGEKYGRLPSSAVTGLSGGDSNWYLVDGSGNVTDTKITRLSIVALAKDHTLFVKRNVLKPTVSIKLSVPGGISDGYQYYIPENSQRVLTATVGNRNDEILDYTYQWYKGGTPIVGADEATLVLPGNVSDSGKYKVEVTATLKNGTGIVVTSNSATAEKEQNVKILHAANTLYYDANGGENGPSSNYTGGATLTVTNDQLTRENYIFCGWNTKADGTGDEYVGGSTYTFAQDNGNGGCKETLYAQWKPVKYTVTYIADGNLLAEIQVEHGKDAVAPEIPTKEGYDKVEPTWDKDGKNITVDTVINAVYTLNEYTITFVDENGVYKEVTYKHGEDVEMPEAPTKDGYTVKWDTNVDKATGNLTIKAVYTKVVINDDPENIPNDNPKLPQTGDDSDLLPWLSLLIASGVGIFGIIFNRRKNKSER